MGVRCIILNLLTPILTFPLNGEGMSASKRIFVANLLTAALRANIHAALRASNFSRTAIYVRRRSLGFADEQFGFHLP